MSSASSPFDRIVPRGGSASMKWDRYRDQDVLPFWVADMDFAIAEPIRQALEQRLAHPVFGYSLAPDGLAPAVQAHLQRAFDWQVEADWLVWLPGVVPGLAASCRAFCEDGDQILVNPPIYQHFYDSHDERRQTLLRVPLQRDGSTGRWSWDIEAMRRACTPRTRMIMLCSPHNPTGTVFVQSELDALAALAVEQDLMIISDEIHCDLVIDRTARHRPTAAACPSIADRSVTLMSGSKTWNMAGLNCSFAIVPNPELRARFATACQSLLPMVPPFAFVATEAAYRDGGPWREQLLDYLQGNYELIRSTLERVPELQLEPLQATYLAWIDASALGLDDARGTLEQHGIGLCDGEQFEQPGFLRMNFACPRATLQTGLERLVAAVAALRSAA